RLAMSCCLWSKARQIPTESFSFERRWSRALGVTGLDLRRRAELDLGALKSDLGACRLLRRILAEKASFCSHAVTFHSEPNMSNRTYSGFKRFIVGWSFIGWSLFLVVSVVLAAAGPHAVSLLAFVDGQ